MEQDRFVFAGTSAVAVFTTRFFGRNPNVENGRAFEQFVREARQACGITIVFGQRANADRTTARKFDDDRLAFARFEDVFDLVVEKFTRLGFELFFELGTNFRAQSSNLRYATDANRRRIETFKEANRRILGILGFAHQNFVIVLVE